MVRPSALFIVFTFLCGSCEPASSECDSLVGATDLPSSAERSREIIQISYGVGTPDSLSYELRPDNSLTVSVRLMRGGKEARREEKFQLLPQHGERTRALLSRLRPNPLLGIEYLTRPEGCKPQHVHDWGRVSVAFIAEGKSTTVQDDKVGITVVPDPESCGTPEARWARETVERVSRSFPPSRLTAAFAGQR